MKYTKIKFPDGQISAKITDYQGDNWVQERINNYEDLFFIKSISDAYYPNQINLFIPCMFGQRSDRRFEPNQSFDLKNIADFINSCGATKVKIFDPHSNDTLSLIDYAEKVSSYTYVQESIIHMQDTREIDAKDIVLVSPDSGAYKKVFGFAEQLNLPVVAANKFRDLQGNINLSFTGDVKDKICLIVDDLCDGGYTFELLGKALKEQGARKVYLYVSHGYFSKGFDKLKEVIDGIYCTNSVKDIEDDYIIQYKII